MKILIITLFVFVTSFVSSSVLADDNSNGVCETKSIGAFYYKSDGCMVILTPTQQNILKDTILKLKGTTQNKTNSRIIEVLKNTIEKISTQSAETEPKKLSESNCKKDNEKKDNEKKDAKISCDKTEIDEVIKACKAYPQICKIRNVVDLYKPNYAMYSYSSGNRNDEALEIQYSGRYNIKKISAVESDKEGNLYINYDRIGDINSACKLETFFSLTGRYDFYAFNDDLGSINRESEQVVNRFFNPALHTRLIFPKSDKLEFIDIGIEHLSNGQSGDPIAENFTAGENDNYEASDSNSISMFFPSISAQLLLNNEKDDIKYKVFARAILEYWSTELDIFSETGVKIGKDDFPDYHKFKIGLILESNSIAEDTNIDEDEWLLELSFTGHKKKSFDAFLSYPVNRIPGVSILDRIGFEDFLLRYHNGYLSRLSNYGLKEETYGIGFGVAF